MLNFDEVYISDIPPAVSIATWYIYLYICPSRFPGLGGQAMCSKWRLRQLHGCRLRTPGAERGRDLDKSSASFYQVRLTTAPRLEFVQLLCKQRYEGWRRTARSSGKEIMQVSSSIAPLSALPWQPWLILWKLL